MVHAMRDSFSSVVWNHKPPQTLGGEEAQAALGNNGLQLKEGEDGQETLLILICQHTMLQDQRHYNGAELSGSGGGGKDER